MSLGQLINRIVLSGDLCRDDVGYDYECAVPWAILLDGGEEEWKEEYPGR
jgi:hypothetical protein